MKFRPGKNLIRILAGGLFLSAASFVLPQIVWFWPPVLLGLLIVGIRDAYYIRQYLNNLSVSRTLPSLAGRDQDFRISWTIVRSSETEQPAKPSMARMIQGLIRDCVPDAAMPALSTQSFELSGEQRRFQVDEIFRIPVRGVHVFGPMWMRVSGPMGLLEGQKKTLSSESIRVFPETYYSADRLAQDADAQVVLLDKASRIRQHGTGTEFESLNEFREGDDPRKIDWRTTARVGHLVVRKYEIERHRDVMLLVDCGRLMGADAGRGSKLDCAVDSALMLARVALRGGDRCGISLFDDQVLGYLPPQAGMSSMQAISECVFAAQTRWRETDFSRIFARLQQRQQKRAMIIVLSDLIDAETTQRFRASLATLARRHVILFAALQTPLMDQMISQPPEGTADSTRLALAFQLLRERERALHAVRRSGIEVLDVVPDRLTVPLINHFLELRRQAL